MKVFLTIILLIFSAVFLNAQLAFPSAEGFGKNATGGRGGTVYVVTSLADTNTLGTLRYGLETVAGDKIIIFNVSGVITLTNVMVTGTENITIEGATSPHGITLSGNGFRINSSNTIVRNIHFRKGSADVFIGDALQIVSDGAGSSQTQNVIVDHCTASWAVDEALDLGVANTYNATTNQGIKNITISNSILGPSNPYGVLISSYVERLSLYRNFYTGNNTRNPLVSSAFGVDEYMTYLRVESINNVQYGGDASGGITYGTTSSWIGNVWKDFTGQVFGGSSDDIFEFTTAGSIPAMESFTQFYGLDNIILNPAPGNNPPFDVRTLENANISTYKVGTPTESSGSTIVAASAIPDIILPNVGAFPRDTYDQSLIDAYYANTAPNTTQTLPTIAGGDLWVDSDADSMPDVAEIAVWGDITTTNSTTSLINSVNYPQFNNYTNIEKAIFSFDPVLLGVIENNLSGITAETSKKSANALLIAN